MITAEELRMAQMKDVFQYGDEDAKEIALIEILNSAMEAGMSLEELVPYLVLGSDQGRQINPLKMERPGLQSGSALHK